MKLMQSSIPEQSRLVLDSTGRCIWPELHDGYLLGLEVDSPQRVLIRLEDRAKVRWQLSTLEVQYLRAVEFREGNIIFDLSIFWKQRCDPAWLTFLFAERVSSEFLQKIEREIIVGSLSLLALTSSYGCELALISRSSPSEFRLEKLSKTEET